MNTNYGNNKHKNHAVCVFLLRIYFCTVTNDITQRVIYFGAKTL
jgi:hypothetical protein